jgi:hypothetical protein
VSGLADGYDSYYQARLWDSLPEMYQAQDFIDAGTPGPLQELLNRIGIQVAVLRRSIDGLWADQFIETCADWVIPYIGDLVAAGQVPILDPRGQRLDVANTVHWRRRKGMLATADAVARDITGWDTHVLEGFRSLARTRHNLDPPPATAEGLVAPLTRTPAGGFADLRSAPGTLLSAGPFDEAFHHADLRRGSGTAGRYGIEKFVVYCWRLLSLEVTGATPVRVAGSRDEYVFDPTGREIPLFLPPLADSAEITGTTRAWQVPGPLTAAVDRIMTTADLRAYQVTGAAARVRPEAGRFWLSAPTEASVTVSYQYGFGGPIGAGTGVLTGGTPLRVAGEKVISGGTGLADALAHAQAGDTVTIADSLTYSVVADVACAAGGAAPAAPLTVRARPGERPVIRLPEHQQPGVRQQWVFTGGEGARLVLDGLFISGGDIVLQGPFDHVKIDGCTLDPGTLTADGDLQGRQGAASHRRRRAAPGTMLHPSLAVGRAVDGRALLPTRVWIEPAPGRPDQPPGQPPRPPDAVRCLEVDRSILGPIRTRGGGLAERVVMTDSILQGFRTSAGAAFTVADVFDPVLLYEQLSPGRATPERPRRQSNPLSAFIWRSAGSGIPPSVRRLLLARAQPSHAAVEAVAHALNRLLDRDIYRRQQGWADVDLSPEADRLLKRGGAVQAWLNRLLLEDAYPLALAPAACAIAEASVHLNRVTVLGRVIAHRLYATDSIMHGFTVAEDPEDGCVRYSAALAGSRLPPQYNSARLSDDAALFTSTAFGLPGYGQLLDTADRAIAAAPPGMTLLAGSSTGAQLGAFPAQIVPVKERALRVKYNEYLPFGLVPVIVHVT